MKQLLILTALLLTACQTTKLVPQFYCPAPDPSLMVPGQQPQTIQKPAKPGTGQSNANIT